MNEKLFEDLQRNICYFHVDMALIFDDMNSNFRSVLGTTSDDVVFEDALAASGSTRALEARVKEVAKQIAAEGKGQEQASLR